MKKIFKHIGLFLTVLLLGAFTACQMEEISESADLGLGIKVFFPTKVVAGQPMTINGSGLSATKEIIFPGNVSTTDFEIVSNDMLRVTAPAGIAAEGGKIVVRTDTEEVESRLPLTLGSTAISGFSKQEGETVNGEEQITIYGSDLEFINGVELLDADGNANLISDADFYRKGTSSVIITVPRKNIFDGTFVGKIYTYDGREFLMPELTYKPVQDAGHWETKKTVVWENDGTKGDISWNGIYRFGLEGNDGNNECIATFPQDVWDVIKDGTFRIQVDVNESSNIRITTGWWSATYGGSEYNALELIQEDEDGNKYIELNIKEDGNIYDLIDAQHLLFTGSGYTLVSIYTTEDVWIEGEEGHWEKTSLWKNDGSKGAISWGGDYRFGLDGNDGNNECLATFPQEVWDIIKGGTFYLHAEGSDWVQMRITTGWWSTTWTGADITTGDERIIDNGDGTFDIELNFTGDPIVDLLDAQHLLFTGSGYTPLEIYVQEWVGGSAAEPVVFWETDGSKGAISWGGDYRFGLDGNDGNNECLATFSQEVWDVIKTGSFYLHATGSDWVQMRITTGWWSTTWTGADITTGDERIVDNGDGTYDIEINFTGDPIVDLLDAQHLLLTGSGYTPLKLYYYK